MRQSILCRAALSLLTLVFATAVSANHYILPCDNNCIRTAVWVPAGDLNVARTGHRAILLQDGRVLVAGGFGDSKVLAEAEVFDPATRRWTLIPSMNLARKDHSATLLNDGRVLVVAGVTSSAPPDFGRTATAEIYDPRTNAWQFTESLPRSVTGRAAVRLQDGRVLVAGGFPGEPGTLSDGSAQAEIYDPATGHWDQTGSLNTGRFWHTLTLLANGEVLAVRGSNDVDLMTTLSSTEIYNPASGQWRVAGDSGEGSVYHSATLLPDGKVMVVGGNTGGIGGDLILSSVHLFDPASEKWSDMPALQAKRYEHSATLLANGDALIVGGSDQNDHYPNLTYAVGGSVEGFSRAGGTWGSAPALNVARSGHTTTLLDDGSILVAGGSILVAGGNQWYDFSQTTSTEILGLSTIRRRMIEKPLMVPK